ncbi:MAG: hypothetical protein Q7T73_06815 [Beijerinckiaceae bacterium]|nr:hypothetical protein [Beijerinckiaceae bacterium]
MDHNEQQSEDTFRLAYKLNRVAAVELRSAVQSRFAYMDGVAYFSLSASDRARYDRDLAQGSLRIIAAAVEKTFPSEMRIESAGDDGATLRSLFEQAPPAVLVAGVDVQGHKVTIDIDRHWVPTHLSFVQEGQQPDDECTVRSLFPKSAGYGYANLDHALEMTLYGEKFSFPVSKSDANRIKAGMDKVQATCASVDRLRKQLATAEADAESLLNRGSISIGPAAAKVA